MMSQTRYCSTCGTLLTEGAAICGECGARYQASPYERRATDAPGAWSQAPKARPRDLGQNEEQGSEDEGVELITRDSLEPKNPGATALRSQEQYDQMMVTQPPTNQTGPIPGPGMPQGAGSPALPPYAEPEGQQMAPPLDGCTPAPVLKRFLAALVDSVIESLVLVPLLIGGILVLTSDKIGLLPQILIGVGAALPVAYHLLMIWLVGSKGFTLGKLILGLRVTRMSQGGKIGFVRALGRWFLYRVVALIMALSIFLDPKKHLRGFHDRIIDSVVVDIKAGRHPFQPRPDDFERADAEHYLGAPSVAVSTHENLLSEPGAAWRDGASAAPSQPAPSGAWGDAQQGAPSPYAPPISSGPSTSAADAPDMGGAWSSPPPSAQDPSASQLGGNGGWAPPPTDPAPQPQAWDQPAAQQQPQAWDQPAAQQQPQAWDQPGVQQQPQAWDQPAAQQQPQAWDQPPAQQSWGQPAPQQQAWDQPAVQSQPQAWGQPSSPEAPSSTTGEGWASAPSSNDPASATQPYADQAPTAQPLYGEAPPAASPYGEQPPPAEGSAPEVSESWGPVPTGHSSTGHSTADAPSDLTGDAWDVDDHGVDEQTRLSVPDDSLGDLEQTRISPVRLPSVPKLHLTTDDGEERVVQKAVVIGRNPSAPGDEVLFVMKDDTRSVSKTHLRIDGSGDEVTVTDLGSTNGSTILRADGSRENLVPNSPTVLPAEAQVTLGDRTLSVEREQ